MVRPKRWDGGSNWLLCKTKQGKKCKYLRTDQAANFYLLLFFFTFYIFFLRLFLFLSFSDVLYFFVIWPPPYKSPIVSEDSWKYLHYVPKGPSKSWVTQSFLFHKNYCINIKRSFGIKSSLSMTWIVKL